MTIQQLKEKKKELGYTYVQIAELSGVPLGTVQKVFNGATASPRYDTLLALEKVFHDTSPRFIPEAQPAYPLKRQGEFTLPDLSMQSY